MHLVLLTGGRQGGGGLRKMGSFTTIKALSSELEDREGEEKEEIETEKTQREVMCLL